MATRTSVEQGKTISEPLKNTDVFPSMVVQMVAVGFLVAGDAGDVVFGVVTPIGLSLLWLSALLTLYTGFDYFRAGVRHLIYE